MTPDDFTQMVEAIRITEKALGQVTYELSEKTKRSKDFSRSLFITEDIKKGEIFTEKNLRSIRPGFGLHTRNLKEILGKKASVDIKKGTPMKWGYVS
jgi:sialic acid synthase SpsE